MRISDWSSDVCSSDLQEAQVQRDVGEAAVEIAFGRLKRLAEEAVDHDPVGIDRRSRDQRGGERHIEKRRQPEKSPCPEGGPGAGRVPVLARPEEHTSALQSLISIPYAVFCLKKQ